MTLHSDTERRHPLESMYYKTEKDVVTLAQDDQPQDLSLGKRSSDWYGCNRTTDHSIANIMKRFADESREEEGMDRKRQRVENIVHSICPRSASKMLGCSMTNGCAGSSRPRKSNRKQVQPQQHGVGGSGVIVSDVNGSCQSDEREDDDGDDNDEERDSNESHIEEDDDEEKRSLRRQLRLAKLQLQRLQRECRELCERRDADRLEALARCLPALQTAAAAQPPPPFNVDHFVRLLRAEISATVGVAVFSSMERFAVAAAGMTTGHDSSSAPPPPASTAPPTARPPPSPSSFMDEERCHPARNPPSAHGDLHYGPAQLASSMTFPGPYHQYLMQVPAHDVTGDGLPEHALALVGKEKKKRTKVTDTRLSPRAAKVLMSEAKPTEEEKHQFPGASSVISSLSPLPTSVAVRNPTLVMHDNGGSILAMNGGCDDRSLSRSTECSDHDSSDVGSQSNRTSTLTPLHLRKAKLMFFYVRYPSSVLLKAFFPDIRFNKNNTAQLVKWFSNFREFYYIQMEKYARQALAEGSRAEDVIISTESELYKILNLHYNRNNQIEVPRSYRTVVEATLKEFVKAIAAGKDQEQSWKKPIYKVIARLDDTVPDFFKSQDWLEQLTD